MTWEDYRRTMPQGPDLFDLARTGNLRGLADLLTAAPQTDLDATNERGYSALMLAVYNSQNDFAEALLRGGADPNSSDRMGNTVLMAAAYKGSLELCQLLLSQRADPLRQNRAGMTALDWARAFKREPVAELLACQSGMRPALPRWKSWLKLISLPLVSKS